MADPLTLSLAAGADRTQRPGLQPTPPQGRGQDQVFAPGAGVGGLGDDQNTPAEVRPRGISFDAGAGDDGAQASGRRQDASRGPGQEPGGDVFRQLEDATRGLDLGALDDRGREAIAGRLEQQGFQRGRPAFSFTA